MSPVLEKIQQNFIRKKDQQQDVFLQRYPKYDGRGVLIATIDGGIDVCLDGMQKTSTGLPKIVDCFDFSSTNDVDTSVVRKTSENNTLLLLSGKERFRKTGKIHQMNGILELNLARKCTLKCLQKVISMT
jgi:hypothetical protein